MSSEAYLTGKFLSSSGGTCESLLRHVTFRNPHVEVCGATRIRSSPNAKGSWFQLFISCIRLVWFVVRVREVRLRVQSEWGEVKA